MRLLAWKQWSDGDAASGERDCQPRGRELAPRHLCRTVLACGVLCRVRLQRRTPHAPASNSHSLCANTHAGVLSQNYDNKKLGLLEAPTKLGLLASFVPALLLKELEKGANLQMPSSQQYEAVALFAVRLPTSCARPTRPRAPPTTTITALRPDICQDISGFSQLNEYFAQLGGVGLGQMMALVNVYFQKMIKICSSCGGDVIKFAGDALIVLWVNEPMSQLAHRACECALELQESLHDAQMTPEISLSLKVGIGLGSATMFYVGGHMDRFEYFAAGPALKECFTAADAAEKGDVIVSSSVFEHVQHACSAERMSTGHYNVVEMRRTYRKKAVSRGLPALTPQALTVLRSYAPPVLLHAAELETQLGQTARSWTVSVVQASAIVSKWYPKPARGSAKRASRVARAPLHLLAPSRVQASIIFIHFGIEGVMDLLALDCAKVHLPPPPTHTHTSNPPPPLAPAASRALPPALGTGR